MSEMKIDTTDMGVFASKMTLDEASKWLMGEDDNLSIGANEAIDEAASWASEYGHPAFIVIEIVPR